MLIKGENYRSAWFDEDKNSLFIINQTKLPFEFEIVELKNFEEIIVAIKEMWVRGAPLLGAVAGYGMYFAFQDALPQNEPEKFVRKLADIIRNTRPTAVDLFHSVDRMLEILDSDISFEEKVKKARLIADTIYHDTLHMCWKIGVNGLEVIEEIAETKKENEPINILTHCNAGWLATIDYGTVTAPLYLATKNNIPIHIWVDETRPRNQGALLTTFELREQGIPFTLIADNTGGLLMQKGKVDLILVGADRISSKGDVANKIGTYLKALAAYDNHVPFYVAAPTSSFDLSVKDALNEIVLEEREPEEVIFTTGLYNGKPVRVQICPDGCQAFNAGFDITPAKYITGIITDKGVVNPNEKEISKLFKG